jgi:hypothetical protein
VRPAALMLCALLSCSGVSVADDTEIFRATYDGEATNSRPKVLIVFDDSGSMDTTVAGRSRHDRARPMLRWAT